jgi:Pyridoxamine 5'-phosphate oxidase
MQYLLDQDTIDLIQSGEVALCLATSDALRTPRATRAFGCKVAADARSLTTWIPTNGHATVLANIRNNGRLALVICHVQSLKAIQFKAVDAQVLPMDSADYARVIAYQQAFIRKTVSMRYPEDVMRTHVQFRVDQLAAVQFTPIAAFMQTPGPRAGAAVGAST